jgi:hypothetical protein
MASIEERNGRYRVSIRKKGIEISQTFSNLETAKLYERYKEDIIDEMHAFDVKDKDLITIEEAIRLNIERVEKECSDSKNISDNNLWEENLRDILEQPISCLTYEFLMNKANEMLSSIIKRGGSRKIENSGRLVQSSPATVLRKFRVLSTVFSNLIKNGVEIENHALKVCAYLRTKMKDKSTVNDDLHG